MRRAITGVVFVLVLAGCARERASSSDTSTTRDTIATPAAIDSTGPAGASDVVLRYYAAIEDRDYRAAYTLWSDGGAASGQTYEEFARGFDATAHVRVEITGPVTMEAAAGSSYAEVPVRVVARTTAGAEQRFTGTYVLRRVNDVPGATPAQLRWSLREGSLRPESAR